MREAGQSGGGGGRAEQTLQHRDTNKRMGRKGKGGGSFKIMRREWEEEEGGVEVGVVVGG